MEVSREGKPGWFWLVLTIGLGFFVWFLFVSGWSAGYERYEVTRTKRCARVVGTKYYQTRLFGKKDLPEEYYVLKDGREVPRADAWEHMEFGVEVTKEGMVLTKTKEGLYCDYLYEKVKKNISSQELKTPR